MSGSRRPETQFAWNGDDAMAFQVLGSGDADLLYLQGLASNIELNWDHASMRDFLGGLARSRRLIVSDVRGMGCSERASPREVWPLEILMDDIGRVMDAAGSERAVVMATQECAFAACMYAAAHPQRVVALILYEAAANWLWSPETPWEWTAEEWSKMARSIQAWSRAEAAENIRREAPSMAGDAAYLDWWYRYVLLSSAPGYWAASADLYMETDLRPLLPAIQVPLLVLSRPQHPDASWPASSAHLASLVPGSRLVSLPGRDARIWLGDQAPTFAAIDDFLAAASAERDDLDRSVLTILVTDMVGSTETATRLGDRAWRRLVERHHATVRTLLQRYRGTEVDTAGDGFLAAFDGPARAIRCAQSIVASVAGQGVTLRAGLHTGECDIIDSKIGGIAVNIGARVAGAANPGEVLVSQTVRDLVAGSGLAFDDRGAHRLKGLAEEWRLYRVLPQRRPDPDVLESR
jgi:class 3 adenylate cyclase